MIINPNKATKKLGGDEDHGSIENENEEDEEGISWGMGAFLILFISVFCYFLFIWHI